MSSHYVVPSQALPKLGGNYSMTALKVLSPVQEPQELPPSCLHQLQEFVFIPMVTEVLSQTKASTPGHPSSVSPDLTISISSTEPPSSHRSRPARIM